MDQTNSAETCEQVKRGARDDPDELEATSAGDAPPNQPTPEASEFDPRCLVSPTARVSHSNDAGISDLNETQWTRPANARSWSTTCRHDPESHAGGASAAPPDGELRFANARALGSMC